MNFCVTDSIFAAVVSVKDRQALIITTDMKKVSIVVILIICFGFQRPVVYAQQKATPIFIDVMFQDYFKNDTVDLKVNNVSIVNRIVLNSNAAGFTMFDVGISKWNAGLFKIDFLDKYKYCHSSDKIKLVVKLNNKITLITIDRRKGKYVGINKNDDNTVYFRQQKDPFMYD